MPDSAAVGEWAIRAATSSSGCGRSPDGAAGGAGSARSAELDDDARARLVSRFGPEVAGWLDRLPELVDGLADRWGLQLSGSARAGGTSVVLRGRTADGPVVVTLSPDPAIAVEEAEALRAWGSCRHVVRLRAVDEARGALLLEEIRPGVPLTRDWIVDDVVPLLGELLTLPLPDPAPNLAPVRARVDAMFDLAARRLEPDAAWLGPLLRAGHRRARALGDPDAVTQPGVVHGDLHPGNVLRTDDDRRVVAIDPRPSIGDRHLDLVDWVLTPDVVDEESLAARLDALRAALPGLDPRRARAWSVAVAPLVLMPLRHDGSTPRARFLRDLAA